MNKKPILIPEIWKNILTSSQRSECTVQCYTAVNVDKYLFPSTSFKNLKLCMISEHIILELNLYFWSISKEGLTSCRISCLLRLQIKSEIKRTTTLFWSDNLSSIMLLIIVSWIVAFRVSYPYFSSLTPAGNPLWYPLMLKGPASLSWRCSASLSWRCSASPPWRATSPAAPATSSPAHSPASLWSVSEELRISSGNNI